ncbi:hypothetical protein MAIT1_03635 [Magnetofaba australis IT-1]|uniref:Uncharacterized protein n=1 Tax=Magnetofaba australis IT-1 TaxID=1434232 RepID=A0A1Y2K4E5_9PROT|nr:hypothetical protein MAIT1_03635 [Magnetofaba australis IT-1]
MDQIGPAPGRVFVHAAEQIHIREHAHGLDVVEIRAAIGDDFGDPGEDLPPPHADHQHGLIARHAGDRIAVGVGVHVDDGEVLHRIVFGEVARPRPIAHVQVQLAAAEAGGIVDAARQIDGGDLEVADGEAHRFADLEQPQVDLHGDADGQIARAAVVVEIERWQVQADAEQLGPGAHGAVDVQHLVDVGDGQLAAAPYAERRGADLQPAGEIEGEIAQGVEEAGDRHGGHAEEVGGELHHLDAQHAAADFDVGRTLHIQHAQQAHLQVGQVHPVEVGGDAHGGDRAGVHLQAQIGVEVEHPADAPGGARHELGGHRRIDGQPRIGVKGVELRGGGDGGAQQQRLELRQRSGDVQFGDLGREEEFERPHQFERPHHLQAALGVGEEVGLRKRAVDGRRSADGDAAQAVHVGKFIRQIVDDIPHQGVGLNQEVGA